MRYKYSITKRRCLIMNKKQMKKELKRMQTVEQELIIKIASANEDVKFAVEKAQVAEQKAAESTERAKVAEQKAAESTERAKVAEQKAAESTERAKVAEQKAAESTERAKVAEQKLDDVEKVQEQQGLDLAALAKAINSLNDTKIKFEDEYADWEDKYNQLAKIAEENDEKLNKMYNLAVEIQNFEECNYRNI